MQYIILLFLFLFPFEIFAQENKPGKKSIEQLLSASDLYLSRSDFNKARHSAEEILQIEADNIHANFKVGFCYLHSIHKERALPYLQKVYQKDQNYNHNLMTIYELSSTNVQSFRYFLAQAYHLNNLFKEAIQFYQEAKNEYLTIIKDPKNAKESLLIKEMQLRVEKCDKKIEECNFGLKYINEPVNTQIDNIGEVINTKYEEYAPVISEDEKTLVFTSRRPETVGGGKDPLDGEYYEDIYISHKIDGKWTSPQNIGRPVNSKFHDACVALSANGKEIFIYKDNNDGTGDIYVTDLQTDGQWEVPKSLGKNINSKYNEPSVSMTNDGKKLYFSSDRPGGYGGLDIYVSEKQSNGEWGEAVNLGPTINTPYRDDAPFISSHSKALYFSSEGHESMGGFDIFSSQFENGQWTKPENLGYPINTTDDDIYFVISASGQTGFYASAKEGGFGEEDIYILQMPRKELSLLSNDFDLDVTLLNSPNINITPVENRTDKSPKVLLRGTVRDKLSKEPLESNIQLNILETAESVEEMSSEPTKGAYSSGRVNMGKNYMISVQKEGYFFHSESFSIPKTDYDQEVIINIELEKPVLGGKINLMIFFDFDKAYLRPESGKELQRLLKFMRQNPNLKVEIAGHTDNIGTDMKNAILSEQRAKAVVDFLKENQIPVERIRYKGYGFRDPIAPNKNPDGSDNPKGRQMNRRTECKIVEVF